MGNTRGASIVIALGMIAAILFFTLGMATTMITSIQNASNSKKGVQAEYAAQGGVEMASLVVSGLEPAVPNPPSSVSCVSLDSSECSDSNNKVEYHVYGLDNSSRYPDAFNASFANSLSIPPSGTGDADDGSCSLSNPDSLCNWNKIYFGQSIEIPLYLNDGTNDFPNAEVSDFYFRLKSVDLSSDLFVSKRVLFNWQITGTSCNTGSCSVVAATIDDMITVDKYNIGDGGDHEVITLKEAYVIDPSNIALTGTLYDFLSNLGSWNGNNLKKPSLKISYIQQPETVVPYFMYQLLYAGGPLAATYKITVDGYAQGFKYSLNGVQSLNSGMFDFAVQN